MERFGKRRLEPGRWAAAQGWKCERPRLTRLAGRAPWRGKLRLRSCVCVGPARLSLQPRSICSLLRQQHAHTRARAHTAVQSTKTQFSASCCVVRNCGADKV